MSGFSQISQFRDLLVEGLRTNFPDLKTVRPHGGDFAEEEIGQILQNAPALHVAILSFRPVSAIASGGLTFAIKGSIFIVTADKAEVKRDKAALNLAEDISCWLDRRTFKYQEKIIASPLSNLSWQNLYSATGQNKGTMLSALSFEVEVRRPNSEGDFDEQAIFLNGLNDSQALSQTSSGAGLADG